MAELVVLLDVDNTLIDSDLVRDRLESDLIDAIGDDCASRFWKIYEEVRLAEGLVDLPKAIEKFGMEFPDSLVAVEAHETIYNFPFGQCVYPQSIQVIKHLSSFATPVILSDGDQVFQRYKIRESGLEAMVGGNVLVYTHKEESLNDVQSRFPASHYVIVDDKKRIHAAVKGILGDLVTTVMVNQGRYALDPAHNDYRSADIAINAIGDLLSLSKEQLVSVDNLIEGN